MKTLIKATIVIVILTISLAYYVNDYKEAYETCLKTHSSITCQHILK